jgi:hypothetical protein
MNLDAYISLYASSIPLLAPSLNLGAYVMSVRDVWERKKEGIFLTWW